MERYELTPIGNLGDYSVGPHTSWYRIDGKNMYLFDVPYSNVGWAMSKVGQSTLHSIEQVTIFITSLKETRIGGLKTFIDILQAMGMPRWMTFIPNDIWMKASNYLEIVGASLADCHLMRGDYYQDDNVQVFPREVGHDGILRSFAYVVYGGDLFIDQTGNNWSIYYSPDNRVFTDESVLASFLERPAEKTIYHDITTNIDDETHCYKDRVIKPIEKKLRSHIYPINIDDPKDARKFKTLGFNIA